MGKRERNAAATRAHGIISYGNTYPNRIELAKALKVLLNADYPLHGASDHGVSEAIYLSDPDGNGVELYYDKSKEKWPRKDNGELEMFTKSLNIDDLLSEIRK